MGELQAIPVGYFDSMTDAMDSQRAERFARREQAGFMVLELAVVPGRPAMLLEIPYSEPPAYKMVEMPYETSEDAQLVKRARQRHADLIKQFGSENIIADQPSLEIALRYGHLFPNDLVVFMVRATVDNKAAGKDTRAS